MTTKEERIAALDEAIELGGGILRFSETMGVSHQAVYAWRKRGAVPIVRASQIEVLLGVPVKLLVAADIARALDTASIAADVL